MLNTILLVQQTNTVLHTQGWHFFDKLVSDVHTHLSNHLKCVGCVGHGISIYHMYVSLQLDSNSEGFSSRYRIQ